MSVIGLEVFDKTLQTTNEWLGEINAAIGPDRRLACKTLSSVLHCLRDRLPIELSAHRGAQLPRLVRGAYPDHYQPDKQLARFSDDGFVEALPADIRRVRKTAEERVVPSPAGKGARADA
ncbi:MAG: DUF2267 domain-containing protein [Alphaproteobacteria bacterium]|nr:DUF2267 domain-containing protein [Alphaproteobacteria bacterium]